MEKSNQVGDHFFYPGVIVICMTMFFSLSPFTLFIAGILYIIGSILIGKSNRNPGIKLIWISLPSIFFTLLLLYVKLSR